MRVAKTWLVGPASKACLGAVVAVLALGCASKDHTAERAERLVSLPLPMAARHLPEGCHAVLHFNLTASRAGAAMVGALTDQAGPEQLLVAQVRALGAIDFERDLSDALVCFSIDGAEVHTVAVLGGDLPRGAIVPVLEGSPGVQLAEISGNEAALLDLDGRRFWATQASDGAIVLGDREQLVAAALDTSERAASLSMSMEAPMALRAEGPALERAMRAPNVPAELASALAGVSRVSVAGGSELSVRVVYPGEARAAEMAAPLRELLDRRLGESARVVARRDGSEVVLDVDSTHFLRSHQQ